MAQEVSSDHPAPDSTSVCMRIPLVASQSVETVAGGLFAVVSGFRAVIPSNDTGVV